MCLEDRFCFAFVFLPKAERENKGFHCLLEQGVSASALWTFRAGCFFVVGAVLPHAGCAAAALASAC